MIRIPHYRAGSVLVLALIAVFSGSPASPVRATLAAGNPIVSENQQPGTDAWQIPARGDLQANDTSNQIKGYASSPSVNVGQSLTFYVTVNPADNFTIDVYRMGWYGGLGGRLLQHVGPLSGVSQPSCPIVDAATHLVVCNWSGSYVLAVPMTWTDGAYVAVLTSAARYQNYVPFVVRNDQRTAALLYQESVNTYQAYNPWGGYSLYDFNSTETHHADKVSFERPYSLNGAGDYFNWEVYMVQWLEQKGYDVTYSTDVDTDRNPQRLFSVKGFLSVGHDEYWTKGMYDAAQAARDGGVSLGFFGSNAIYWQARYEPSPTGVPDRVLVCYKTNEPPNPTDPITASNPSLTTTQWRLAPLNRPEQALLGVQFSSQTGSSRDQTVPYVVTNSTSWVYANTGLHDGDVVQGIVGYETDRVWSNQPQPANQSLALLSQSPYTSVAGANDVQNAVIYQATSGAWVFTAGTMAWSFALARQGYESPDLQQATTNILDRFVGTSSTAASGGASTASPRAGASSVAVTPAGRATAPSQRTPTSAAAQPSPAPVTATPTLNFDHDVISQRGSGGHWWTSGPAVIALVGAAIAGAALGAVVIPARRRF